jgi:Heterokaryon incompatibility protein (HET)
MRLLKRLPGGDFELISFNDDGPPPYAILSHTWTEGQEVTYNELLAGTGKDKTGYAKIRFCGGRAAADGLQYFWVDTCCIDKSTSDELSTAINSMFRWYQRASKCYVYLSDVFVPEEVTDAEAFQITWEEAFRRSRWFTRGWTLQELLAPATVEFFSMEGKRLGSRISLEQEIHEITKIPIGVLRGQSLTEFSVEERMTWAAKRTTTLKEDKVYCLLGIFEVFLSLIYGEGEAYATLRLREEIQRRQEGRGTESLHDLSSAS